MRCAVYARLSPEDVDNTDNTDIQVKECQEYAAEQGWSVVTNPFVDDDISASRYSTKPRKDYQRLIEASRPIGLMRFSSLRCPGCIAGLRNYST
jgi:site-specific DNA recombinase